MKTLEKFSSGLENVPATTSWYLSDLGEALGKQELFTKQTPQKLKSLREHALIESAISSNRIEGVEVERKRIGTIIFGKSLLKDRDEEEVRGYRKALDWIHKEGQNVQFAENKIKKFHSLIRGEIWDAGKYKIKDGDIIEKLPNGRERVRFKTVTAKETPQYMRNLVKMEKQCLKEKWLHPLINIAASNLDFLCIHPFRDGNGRVSRLLMLLQCYHAGYEVGRYISLERLIEQNKERYYETLEQSSRGWHQGKHNPWPYINYLLWIFKEAYKEFEQRVGETGSKKGAKTEQVINSINKISGDFSVADLQRENPGVSVDMIRKVLKDLRANKVIECLGRGPSARWRKIKKKRK